MAYDVIVSGHLCADLLPNTSSTPLSALASPGKLFEIGALLISTGGAVSNTGLALHRLGVNVGLMTAVGDDLLGRVIIAKLKEQDERLGDLISIRQDEASSYSVILSPENTDRIILHCPGNNTHFDVADVDFDLVRESRLFHLGYPTVLPRLTANEGAALRQIFQRVYEDGVITSLDMTYPDANDPSGQIDWRPVLEGVLPFVDVFLPSIEEIVFMLRRADHDRWQADVLGNITQAYLRGLADEVLAMGVAIGGFKLGEYGFYLRTAADTSKLERLRLLGQDPARWQDLDLWHPAFEVEVVGTTGAGDCAYGGFLASLLRGLGPEDTLRMACALGASNVEAADSFSGLQSWEDTQARIERGWATRSKRLPGG